MGGGSEIYGPMTYKPKILRLKPLWFDRDLGNPVVISQRKDIAHRRDTAHKTSGDYFGEEPPAGTHAADLQHSRRQRVKKKPLL